MSVAVVGVLLVLSWMLLTVGCVLLASAFTSHGGFSLHDPQPRPRNVGLAIILGAVAVGVIAVVVAFQ